MRTVEYNEQPKSTGNTQTHLAVDEAIKEGYNSRRLEQGFSASDGVRGATMETGGSVKHPEKGDAAITEDPSTILTTIDNEDPGLADD